MHSSAAFDSYSFRTYTMPCNFGVIWSDQDFETSTVRHRLQDLILADRGVINGCCNVYRRLAESKGFGSIRGPVNASQGSVQSSPECCQSALVVAYRGM